MVRMGLSFAGLGILLALALAGCAPESTSVASSPQPSATTHSAVASPTPSPTRDALVVSADGIGPIRIGQPVSPGAATQVSIVFNPHHCGVNGSNYPDWEPVDATHTGFTLAISGTTQAAPVSDLEVDSSELATANGIHIGSTLDQLKAAYPSLDVLTTRFSSDLYIVRGAAGQLVFEVAHSDYAGDSRGGLPGTVIFISILSPSETPATFADSDVAIGGCS